MPVVSKESRKLARFCVYFVLAFCILADGGLGEGAISGCCDVGYLSKNGTWSMPGAATRTVALDRWTHFRSRRFDSGAIPPARFTAPGGSVAV